MQCWSSTRCFSKEEIEQLRQWEEELEELDLEAQLEDEESGNEGSGDE